MSALWQRALELFEAVSERPPEERQAFLAARCGDDRRLHRRVEELLAADQRAGTFLALSGELAPREKVGSYRVLRELGRGGMSTVYLAERADRAFERRVVIKVLRSNWPGGARRLEEERRIQGAFDHPNICRVLDGGTLAGGAPFLVMEFVAGLPIDHHCEQRRAGLETRLELFRKVCLAVDFAHRNLVIHRDLKPSNILVTGEGEPKLLDFGIAALVDPTGGGKAPPAAGWMTPGYASPEQRRGEPVTTASDVYSLGVLLHRLLTGELPMPVLDEETSGATFQQGGLPIAPSRVLAAQAEPVVSPRRVAGDLDAIVRRALAAEPEARYRSAERLAADLERSSRDLPVAARRGGALYRAGKLVRRRRWSVAAALLALVTVFLFSAAMAHQSLRLAQQRDQARAAQERAETVVELLRDVFQVAHEDEPLSLTAAVRRTADSVDRLLADDAELRLEMLATTGVIFRNLGRFEAAESQLRRAADLGRSAFPGELLRRVPVESSLAVVETWLGRPGGEERVRRAVEALRRMPAAAVPASTWVHCLNDWVEILCYGGRFAAADEPSEEAWKRARELPERSLARAQAGVRRGQVLAATERPEEALEVFREALALHRRYRGEDHPETAMALVALARASRRAGDLAAARDLYEEAIAAQRKVFGDDSTLVAVSLNNLAPLLRDLGDLGASEAAYRQALERVQAHYPAASPPEILTLSGLATTLLDAARPAAAEKELRQAMVRWSDPPPLAAVAESLLGEALWQQGRRAEGLRLMRSAATTMAQALGPEHRHSRQALERLERLVAADSAD